MGAPGFLWLLSCVRMLHGHAACVDTDLAAPSAEWCTGEVAEATSEPGVQFVQKRMQLSEEQVPLGVLPITPLVAPNSVQPQVAPTIATPSTNATANTTNTTSGGVCTTYHEEAPQNVLGFKASPFDIVADTSYLGGTRNYYANLTGAVYLLKNEFQNIQVMNCNVYIPGQSCTGEPAFTREILVGGWFLHGRKLKISAQIGTPAWQVSLDDQDAVGMGSAEAPNWTYGQQLNGSIVGESDVVNISVTDVTYTEHRLSISLPFGVSLDILAVVSKLYGTYFNVERLEVANMPGTNEGVCGNADGNITNDFQQTGTIDLNANGQIDSTIHQPGPRNDLSTMTVTIPGFPTLARLQQVLELCGNNTDNKAGTWCDTTGSPKLAAFSTSPLLPDATKMCESGVCLSPCSAGVGDGQIRIGRDRWDSYASAQRSSRGRRIYIPRARRGRRVSSFRLGRITERTTSKRDAECALLCLQEPNCTAWSYGGVYRGNCVGYDGVVTESRRMPRNFRRGWRHAGKRSGTFRSCALGMPFPVQPSALEILASQMFNLTDTNMDESITRAELLQALTWGIVGFPNSSVPCTTVS